MNELTSSPFRPAPPQANQLGPRWLRAVRGVESYIYGGVFRIVGMISVSIFLITLPERSRAVGPALALVSAIGVLSSALMAYGCLRMARLPQGWSGGTLPALSLVVCLVGLCLDASNVILLRDFGSLATQLERSNRVDQWFAIHFAATILVGGQPFTLLVSIARIAHRLGDSALGRRAQSLALFIPLAVSTLSVMRHMDYGRTSILLPAALPLGGPFGVMGLTLLAIFVGLLFRLNSGMKRVDPLQFADARE